MTPTVLRDVIIAPTCAQLGKWATPAVARRICSAEASDLLLAIAIQESGLRWREQQPDGGPARSWWQIEPQTWESVVKQWDLAARLIGSLRGAKAARGPFMAYCDSAACAVARGILWLDPAPLPFVRDDDAWEYYLRTWRPGAYTRGNADQRAALRRRWNRSVVLALSVEMEWMP